MGLRQIFPTHTINTRSNNRCSSLPISGRGTVAPRSTHPLNSLVGSFFMAAPAPRYVMLCLDTFSKSRAAQRAMFAMRVARRVSSCVAVALSIVRSATCCRSFIRV
jgi:hypothetical protein